MNTERQRERELFLAALEMPSTEERRSFLERECGADAALRERLVQLLECNETADCFFKALPVSWDDAGQGETIDAEGVGATLSHYKLLEVIGKGGFGVVYMAEQTEPIRRRVAVKVLKQGLDTQEVIARFEAERQALAMLDHPNVAKVLEAGATDAGRPYFVMELVPGCPITEYCDQNRLTARERLELFIPVCLAVQHAHQKGIIHRDLKPSNILVTRLDGRAVPKIIDFGVAKAIAEPLATRTLFTRFGRMIGTPAYMSPEQAELSGTDIDTRSDIYSLGVVLYELLTGKAPLEPERLHQAALAEMQRIIHEEEPPRPSARVSTLGNESRTVAEQRQTDPQKLGRLLAGDLDWIVMKTLEKDRQRRYASAGALAEDIERHLREQPVMAGPPRLSYRVGKFVRRHRRMALTLALGMVFLLTGFLAATAGYIKAKQERDRAVAAEDRSDRERRLAMQEARKANQREARERMTAYASDMSLGKAAADSGDLGRTWSLLDRHWPAPGQTDLRDWEWRYLWKQCQSDALATLYRHTNAIYKLSISPDGQEAALGGFDGTLLVIDLDSRRLKARLQDSGPPCLVQFSPRANLLAATDAQGRLRLWSTAQPSSSELLDGPARLASVAFSRDGGRLAGMDKTGRLWLWDVLTRRVVTNHALGLPYDDTHCGGLVFAGSSNQVWVGGQNGLVALVELSSGQRLREWRAHAGLVTSLDVSPRTQALASGAGFVDSTVKEWDPVQSTSLGEFTGHRAWISALAYSPDGALLASASADQTVGIWDATTHQLIQRLRGHRHEVWTLAFCPGSRLLVSGSKDGTVNLWRTGLEGKEPFPKILPWTSRQPVFTSETGDTLVCVSKEGRLLRWNGTELQSKPLPQAPSAMVRLVRGAVARGVVACVAESGEIHLLDMNSLEAITSAPLPAVGEGDLDLKFSRDGRFMIRITSGGRLVHVTETHGWTTVAQWRSDPAPLLSANPSPDGAFLASCGDQLRIWKLSNGELLHACQAHKQPTDRVAFSPNGRFLATASQEGSAKLWEVGTWRELAELRGHLLGVHCLAFSPNSQRLATGSADLEAIKLWDLRTYREVFNIPLTKTYVAALGFSPDGNTLCAFGQDDQGFRNYLWRVPALEQIDAPVKTVDPADELPAARALRVAAVND